MQSERLFDSVNCLVSSVKSIKNQRKAFCRLQRHVCHFLAENSVRGETSPSPVARVTDDIELKDISSGGNEPYDLHLYFVICQPSCKARCIM